MAENNNIYNQKDAIESNTFVGAPEGNQNAAKGRQVTAMLTAALNNNDKQRLRDGVEAIASAFASGEKWAVEVVFDRLEGKPNQSIEQKTELSGKLELYKRTKQTREEWLASLVK